MDYATARAEADSAQTAYLAARALCVPGCDKSLILEARRLGLIVEAAAKAVDDMDRERIYAAVRAAHTAFMAEQTDETRRAMHAADADQRAWRPLYPEAKEARLARERKAATRARNAHDR